MLILVRHGQTDANAAGLLQGHADRPLNDLGRAQAGACAAALASVVANGATVVSSPLIRAQQTAAIIGNGRPVEVQPEWIELNYGKYDLRPTAEIPADVWKSWRTSLAFAPPDGESIGALGERVRRACVALAERARIGDVVVVSHVSPIKAAVAWALGVGDETSWRMRLDQATITRVTVGPQGPALVSFNETGHLASLE